MNSAVPTRSPKVSGVIMVFFALLIFTGCNSPDDDVSRFDLTEERPVAWENAEVISQNSIRVYYLAGSAECYGARAIVNETASEIQIAIVEGRLPDSPDVCTLEARNASMVVETQQPIDDRDVVPLTDPELNS